MKDRISSDEEVSRGTNGLESVKEKRLGDGKLLPGRGDDGGDVYDCAENQRCKDIASQVESVTTPDLVKLRFLLDVRQNLIRPVPLWTGRG
jgi:hypothetical protein